MSLLFCSQPEPAIPTSPPVAVSNLALAEGLISALAGPGLCGVSIILDECLVKGRAIFELMVSLKHLAFF